MGNMGTIPATGYESSVVQTFSSPTGTSHTMTYTASVNDMILVINNVIQEPTVAYTTSGTTLTTGTLISGDTMYIIYLALTRQTSAPGADTVTNAMIVDNAINSEHYTDGSIDLAHMSVNSIDSDQYVDASIDNAHLADDAVGVDELSATGTASSSTFLRGDNAWATAGVSGLTNNSNTTWMTVSADEEVLMPLNPSFEAYLTATQSNVTGDGTVYDFTGAIWTEVRDIGGCFSNGTFTAPIAGWYAFFMFYSSGGLTSSHNSYSLLLRMPASNLTGAILDSGNIGSHIYAGDSYAQSRSIVAYLAASDTAYLRVTVSGSSASVDIYGGVNSRFSARLVG